MAGRAEELDALRALLPGGGDHARLALVWGEAGSGKSRLARALVAAAPGETVVVRCAGHPNAPTSYGLVQEAVAAFVNGWAAVPVEFAAVPGAVSAVLGERWPALATGANPPVQRVSALRVAAAILRAALGEGPRVLVAEDLHWADADSVATIAELLRDEARDLLVVGMVRDEQIADPSTFEVLRRHPRALHIRLSGLSVEGVAALLSEHFGRHVPMQVVAAVHTRTDGLPLWIEELLVGASSPEDLVGTSLPYGVTRWLTTRLDALPGTCRTVAEAAAVLGERVEQRLLAEVSVVPADVLEEALGLLVDQQVLFIREPGSLSFRHALTREVVAARVLPDQRRRWHEQAHTALRTDADDSTLAWHAAGAGLGAHAVSAATRGARAALDRGSGHEALRLAELGLAWRPEDVILHELAARAAYVRGLYDVAQNHARRWREGVAGAAEGAEVDCLLASLRWHFGDRAGQWLHLQRAFDAVEGGACTPTAARVYAAHANACLRAEQPAEAVCWADRALLAATTSGAPDVVRRALTDKGSALLELGPEHVDEGLALLDIAIAQARATHDLDTVGRAVNNGLNTRLSGVAPAAAWQIYDDASALLSDLGCETATGKVVRHGVDLAEETGQWQRGWDIVTARLPVETDAVERVVLGSKAALLALERGYDDEAVALHQRVVAEGHGMDQYWAGIYQALLDVAVSSRLRGPSEAVRSLTRYRAAVTAGEHQRRAYRTAQAGLWALDGGVSPGQIRGFLAAIGVTPTSAGAQASFDHLDCALLEAEGSLAAAVARGLEAAGSTDLHGAWLADVHTRLGRCLLGTGRADEARRHIGIALELLAQWPGWRRLKAEQALVRLDAPDRELTAREHEVRALVADGLSNRDIAERLAVSPRTVAVHVSRILAKTNCRSRTELAVSTLRPVS